MVSIKDIARAAQVSHSTVSRALRNSPLVNTQTRALIHKLAGEAGYRVSAVGRSLVTKRTNTIGVVVTTIADPFAGEVVSGIEEFALTHDYSVILAACHQGAPVGGAQIRLQNQATGAERKVASDANGQYVFTLIPPGRYDIEAAAQGFKTFHDTGFPVDVAAPAHLDILFSVGSVTERVEVVAEVSMLNTDSAAQGTVIGDEKIESLPLNGRQFIDLALLSPNVTAGGRSVQQNQVRLNQNGGFSASGNRTNNNGFLLDGVSNVDVDYMSPSLTPILDTISEFQVQTAQLTAEYGHSAGAQINVVTKSGTNDWHGDAWEFVRNRVFDARLFNDPATLPQYQRNQFGATAGGPIRKNKLFIFGGYERLTLRQAGGSLTTVTVPTALERQGNFSQSNVTLYDALTSPRTTFQNDTIPLTRLNPLSLIAINAAPGANVPGSANQYVNGDEVLKQDSNNYSVRLDYVLNQTVTFFGRYSGTRENDVTPGSTAGSLPSATRSRRTGCSGPLR